MFKLAVVILLVFIFGYSKNRLDRLQNEINNLKTQLKTTLSPKEELSVLKENQNQITASELIETTTISSKTTTSTSPVSSNTALETSTNDLEFKFGSKVFTAIGIIAIILAVGFFLSYAFENNLINIYGRIILGVIAGLILLLIGEITRSHYPKYGQALTGGGLGVLYLSFYAAFSFYNLLAQPISFLMMVLVTVAWNFIILCVKILWV